MRLSSQYLGQPTAFRGGGRAGGPSPYVAALLLLAPIFFVIASLASGPGETQTHIWATTGPRYLSGTLLLCLIVGVGVALVGGIAAGLVALTDFPGRRVFSVALILPFAVPAYISAYAYADFLGPFGPVAGLLGGPTKAALLPPIRSLGGAGFILILSAYAYVYLSLRASFAARSGAFLEAARTLGARPTSAAFRVLLPAGRPALVGGLALALMETVADFGVADYFGAATMSVGVFRTWYGFGDLLAASQIAAGLFLLALLLTIIEQQARRGRGAESARAIRSPSRIRLKGVAAVAAAAFCGVPVVLGFVIPAGVLIGKVGNPLTASALSALVEAAANTGALAAGAAAIAMLLAVTLAFSTREARRGPATLAIRIATLGYALPGAVLAIGVLGAASALRTGTGLVVEGLALLAYALIIRFLTAAYNATEAGFEQIHPLSDDAARMLGVRRRAAAARIHMPLAFPALCAGFLIVLVDVAKELPATLLLRPFNFETLATRIYRLASDERLAEAAPSALLLIVFGLAAVLLLEAFLARGVSGRAERSQ